MYKLVRLLSDDIPEFCHIAKMGGYNDMPQPCREISWDDFVHKFTGYTPGYIEFRQIQHSQIPNYPHKWMADTDIWHYSGQSVAIIWPRTWRCGDVQKGESSIVSTEEARFYLIGCEHTNNTESKKLGRCWYGHKCLDCGYTWEIDSSD